MDLLIRSTEADVPAETTSLAAVKRLLLQMLEINIGHKKFFSELAGAYRVSMSNNTSTLEKSLWECLEIGLKRFQSSNNVVIVADGLDDIHGGERTAKETLNKLGSLSANHPNIQVITTSRNESLKPGKGKSHCFGITADHTHEDLRTVIDRCLGDYQHFKNRSEHARENLVDQLLHAARGNFLWAILTVDLLRRETSEDSFAKAVKVAKETPLSLEDTIAKIANTIDFGKTDTTLLLSWMLVVERPLSAQEFRHLIQIDLHKKRSHERKTDFKKDIKKALGALVVIRGDFVRFRHSAIRSYMFRVQEEGKKLLSYKAAHTDLATRLVAYCSFSLAATSEVLFTFAGKQFMERMFSAHLLLEYAVRNWTLHFRASTMYRAHEAFHLTDEFRHVFPNSTQLVMLEWACWGVETSRLTAMDVFDLALRVRQDTFTDKHACTLQSLIVCGSIWRDSTRTSEAADCFYRASVIGRQILSKYHAVIASCTVSRF